MVEVLVHLRAVLMNESMTDTLSPELFTNRISKVSLLCLKYCLT